jgi:hypothetical protein
MFILNVSFDPFGSIIFGFAVEVAVKIDDVHLLVGPLKILDNTAIGNFHQDFCEQLVS